MNPSKSVYVIVIIFVLFVAIISGYIYFTGEEKNNKSSYYEYHFELEIESDNQTTVLWPIPYDAYNQGDKSYGNLSDLINHLEVQEGTGSINVNETEHGRALKITFNDTIRIKGNKRLYKDGGNYNDEYFNYFFDDLTMRNETEDQEDLYFIYSSLENVEIVNFNCYYEHIGELDSVRMVDRNIGDLTLEKGWQLVSL